MLATSVALTAVLLFAPGCGSSRPDGGRQLARVVTDPAEK